MERAEELLRESAERWPRRLAVVDESCAVDYQCLQQRTERAKEKLARAGLRPGHCLAVMLNDGWEFIASALGAVACGAVVMPVSPRLKRRELETMLGAASFHALLDHGDWGPPIEGRSSCLSIGGGVDLRLTWLAGQQQNSVIEMVPDAAFIRFTSGTTGSAKGVVLSHRAILERTAAANRALQLGTADTVLCVLPMAYHFFVSILLYLRYGATLAICRQHLAQVLIAEANRHRATFLYAAPMHCRWLAADESGTGFSHLKRVVSTSMSLDSETARRFLERYGLPISQAYGIIEVGLPIANLDRARDKPGSVGRPLPDYEIKILGDDFQPLPTGQLGQLAVRGPGMFSAYLAPPAHRDEILHDGWFLSTDFARLDADGDITIAGRSVSVINVAGEKIFPEEVQEILNLHPAVTSSRAFGRKAPHTGEAVHAEVVLESGEGETSTGEITSFCRKHLSGFKVPQSVTVVESIAQTPSGKIRQH
jgi:long-chain acyl-CoA synthetase